MISLSYLFEQEKDKKMEIGVIGYSAQKFDEEQAKKLILLGLEKVKAKKGDHLVSGLTNLGIPKLAYEIATNMGLITVGIACKLANDYDLFPVDIKIIKGDKWGDESETFLNYIDTLIKVGGGPQSEKEYEKFKGPKFKFELPAIK
jgi:hypothetical protein